jgi:tetratricopeptide (TPR) repeat protein
LPDLSVDETAILKRDALLADAKGDTSLNLAREPLLLFILVASLGLLFASAWVLTRAFHSRQQQLAQQWYERGQAELAAGRSELAIGDFRSALLYEHNNVDYRWSLAEALVTDKQYGQAEGYFESLLASEPADGRTNQELARVAVRMNKVDDAFRYYENAIYGVWSANAPEHRSGARLELIQLLLGEKRYTEAEAQLVALTAELPNSPAIVLQVAGMFAAVGDNDRAAALFNRALRSDPQNVNTLKALATAEFQAGHYAAARQQLAAVLQREPSNQSAAAMERTAAAVLSLDPYARVTGPERRARVIRDFQIAAARLQQCRAVTAGTSAPMTADLQALDSRQASLASQMTDRKLRDDPDIAQETLDVIFSIEREAQSLCGPPRLEDDALLRIAATHAQ